MSKNAIKVLAAVLIWVTAGYFAWTYYKRLFPDLPGRRGGRAGRTFVHPDKEIAAFMKGEAPEKLVVKIKRSKPGSEPDTFSRFGPDRSEVIVSKGRSVGETFSTLRNLPAWKVTQLPRDMNRWDVFARTPKRENGGNRNGGNPREEIAKSLLSYLEWDVKTGQRPAVRYRFRSRKPEEGSAPPLSEFTGRESVFTSRRWRPNLGQVVGMAAGWGDQPIVLQAGREVRDRRPLMSEGEEFRVPRLSDPDQLARFLCALYGVACDKSEGKTEAFLVYHPKYTRAEDIKAWEEGQPVTFEEKLRAAEQAESAPDNAETTATAGK